MVDLILLLDLMMMIVVVVVMMEVVFVVLPRGHVVHVPILLILHICVNQS